MSQGLKGFFVLFVVASFAASSRVWSLQGNPSASGREAVSSRDVRAGFGKPETISGTISEVDQRGLLMVKREGPSEPSTTQLTVTETHNNSAETPQSTEVQTAPGPGQTDYTFRITSSTQIRIDGQSKSLADLAGFENRRATVHFIPRRSGNFAYSVRIER